MYDVIIIGGGASGFGCALTLASVEKKFDWIKEKKYLLIDDENSDIKKASFFNLTGVDYGIDGDILLLNMKEQLNNFNSCEQINDKIIKIKKIDNDFIVFSEIHQYTTKIIVIATGMHKFNIDYEKITVLPHNKIMKSNKIYLSNDDNLIEKNIYVAGLASGVKTMFAIANGDGVKVACDILELWTGKCLVAHDNLSKR